MLESARRANRRYRYETAISHDIVLPDILYDGKIYNFSNDGVYFESNEQILPGDEISITITKKPQKDNVDTPKTFDVEILWRKKIQGSSYRYGYGAKLLEPKGSLIKLFGRTKLENEDLNNHHQINALDEKDPRAHPRKIYNTTLKYIYRKQRYQGFATNVSRGGAFIETKTNLSIGEKIALIIHSTKTRKIVRLKGWIIRQDETGFGIKFDLRSGQRRRAKLDRRVITDRRERLGPTGWSQDE
jgi:Tfp pilus assembly protein PilZ